MIFYDTAASSVILRQILSVLPVAVLPNAGGFPGTADRELLANIH
jgi:hypothetical protein